jgi:uncharacterized 2Fe-2S/4Fe-4S cluster protein (DUF4445 family)
MSQSVRLEVESAKGQQTILVGRGRSRLLTEILRRERLPLNTRCGQRGLCDGCIVELLEGTLVKASTGEKVTTGNIHGCEYRLDDTLVRIRIPARSLLAYEPQAVSEFRLNVPRAHDPVWQTVAAPITQTKRRRPIRGLPATTGFATMEYRDDHWLVTGVADQPPSRALGAAVDIGTTTVAVMLVDLVGGKILGRAADFNKQMHLGDDVATRIGLCATDPAMLGQLQDAVVNQTIVPLLDACLRQANADRAEVKAMAVAANTTMLHLFAGVDPTPMGTYPFAPAFLAHRPLELPALPGVSIHLLPSAGAYIGADLTAGILASGLAYDDGPSLLVDVGTNGEIILKTPTSLLGCATAAGPAFEGAGLTNGIRAGAGAVERLHFQREPFTVRAEVIGNVAPIGVCGSAYVDLLAEGRRAGLLTPTGRFQSDGTGDWVQRHEDGLALRVARGQGKHDILVSETDVAHLLQSKGAIGAGILTLLERAGLQAGQIQRLYLAGGFGMHIDIPNAIACGLLPGFKPDQVQVVGNTSLAGAYLGLLDCGALDEIGRISQHIEIVELNLDPGFESRYIDQLCLP